MNRFVILILGLLMVGSLNGFAHNGEDHGEEAAAPATAAPAGMDKMMTPEMMKYMTPGENHKRLDVLVGKWKHTVKWLMTPDGEIQTMYGTNENKWILDGRFIQQEAKGEATETHPAFQGIGITGYDNVKGEYNSVWIDNMGTGMMIATGQFDTGSNAIQESGTFSCPMTGEKSKNFRAAWKIVDNDHYTYEMHTTDKDGKEFKNMEVSYERVQ